MREFIETERRLYFNRGPWFNPLAPMGGGPLTRGSLVEDQAPEPSEPSRSEPSSARSEPLTPSDWNNLWYYRGW